MTPRRSSRFDLIMDTASNCSLRGFRRLLGPAGSLVLVGGEGEGPVG